MTSKPKYELNEDNLDLLLGESLLKYADENDIEIHDLSSSLGTGWRRGNPDFRDLIYQPGRLTLSSEEATNFASQVPSKVDLTINQPYEQNQPKGYDGLVPIYNQGNLGACVAFSSGAMMTYNNLKQDLEDTDTVNDIDRFTPSRLFIYYNARVKINSVNSDSGCVIRDAIKNLNVQGTCRESEWPYTISKYRVKPPTTAYQQALGHQSLLYFRITNGDINAMKSCIAEGFPFVFGFTVYSSFMSNEVAKTGMMPMPLSSEKSLGGHAIMAVGYDNDKQVFKIRNSWGSRWGDKGYFYMPYKYISNKNLCSDFWTIKRIEESADKAETIAARILERQLGGEEEGGGGQETTTTTTQ